MFIEDCLSIHALSQKENSPVTPTYYQLSCRGKWIRSLGKNMGREVGQRPETRWWEVGFSSWPEPSDNCVSCCDVRYAKRWRHALHSGYIDLSAPNLLCLYGIWRQIISLENNFWTNYEQQSQRTRQKIVLTKFEGWSCVRERSVAFLFSIDLSLTLPANLQANVWKVKNASQLHPSNLVNTLLCLVSLLCFSYIVQNEQWTNG